MSEKTILEKLRLKAGRTLLLYGAPEHYLASAGEVLKGAAVTNELPAVFIHQISIRSQAELESAFEKLAPLILPGGMLWVTYPKSTSKLKGDIHRATFNAYAQKMGRIGIAIVSIDDEWSALRLKRM